MRFSLQDVRKNIRRSGAELQVSLHFLRPGTLHSEIASLLAYHERMLGQPRRLFALDEARACIGEYRLADCLIATVSNWYAWRARDWSDVVPQLNGNAELAHLSPVQLRLALYSYINAGYEGFLDARQRAEALKNFAALYQVEVSVLETLLILDSEGEGLLTREAAQAPAPQDVATLYNQWVFEAALFNASAVRFVIDCGAFAHMHTDDVFSTGSGVGAVIKRLCYLARRIGVYYDLAYEAQKPAPGQAPVLALTLYGPQEVTGAPQQYGLRLARLCRTLLGYSQTSKKATLSGGIVSAEATVHFLQRSYQLSMDAQMLRLLPPFSPSTPDQKTQSAVETAFDSGVEQSFAEAFQALTGGQGVDGWHLEREPEPLLLERSLIIPDFALTRGPQRLYVEILGFWTPTYRERKIQKLRQLQDRNDILLMIPLAAKDAFAAITESFPVVYYREQLAIADLLQTLRQHYDDFAQRSAQLDLTMVREQIRTAGFLPEVSCYPLLHCYRRAELRQVAERICTGEPGLSFVAGLGFYVQSWEQQLRHSFLNWLQDQRTASSDSALQMLKHIQPELAICGTAALEGLLELWPEIRIRRDSIFESVIELADSQETQSVEKTAEKETTPRNNKTGKEKRSSNRKRPAHEPALIQENLWG